MAEGRAVVEARESLEMPGGNEPFDAYRTLQLMPSAPHDLVEQAYWVLVTRTRSRGSNSSRLGRLNDAYATLINSDRRAAYDLEHNLTKLRERPKFEMPKRPMFARKPKFTTRLTHYQVLDIDFEAVPEVVDTAYVFHKAQLLRSDPKSTFIRSLLEDAFNTLSDPARRAAYDDKVAPRKSPDLSGAPAHKAPAVEAAEPPAPAPLFPKVEAAPPVAQDAVAPEAPAEEVLGAPVAPVAVATAAVVVERRGLGGWIRDKLNARQSASQSGKTERAVRIAAAQEVIDAEQRRLSDLGMLAEPAPGGDEEPRPMGRARFHFTDGPHAGRSVGLTENSLILGASEAADVVLDNPDGMIGAGHVRVWRREDEYILHQLDSFSTTYVNGDRLDLRLAILEPGDEIRIGPHTLIFDEVPIEEAEALAAVEA
jgi:hypothetical protein